MSKLKILIIFVLLFNVVHAKNSSNKNTVLHWCNLPSGYVEQSPLRGFNFMKLIELSKKSHKNKGKYFAMVDDEDYDFLNQWNWSVFINKYGFLYAVRSIRNELGGHRQKTIKMHRLILGVTNPIIHVDHKDHNGLNNQRNNIREATQQQNTFNRRPIGRSKYIGVCWNKRKNRWQAYVKFNSTSYHLGYFKSEEEAAMARDIKATELHGCFANLNFKQ